MDSPFIIPLAAFALAVVIVAIVSAAKVYERETEVHRQLHEEELEHLRKTKELEAELERVRKGPL